MGDDRKVGESFWRVWKWKRSNWNDITAIIMLTNLYLGSPEERNIYPSHPVDIFISTTTWLLVLIDSAGSDWNWFNTSRQPSKFTDMAVGLANRKGCIKVDANASMTDITFLIQFHPQLFCMGAQISQAFTDLTIINNFTFLWASLKQSSLQWLAFFTTSTSMTNT